MNFTPPSIPPHRGEGRIKAGKSKIFLAFCLSFILGVFLGRYLSYNIMAVAAMIFIILISVFWDNRLAVLLGFLGLVMLAGSWRYQTSFISNDKNFIGRYYGQSIELEGLVVKDPDVRSDKVNLTLTPTSPPPHEGEEGRRSRIVGNILVTAPRYPEYQYGDKLKLFGKLEEPFETPDFSYKNYLARYDIYELMRYPKIEKIAEGQGNRVTAAILAFKHKFIAVLTSILPEPHNALALGILLGLKRALPESLSQALIICGVSHIVVISGYNISIISRNLIKTRGVLGKRIAFAFSFLAILGFVILTGAEASVIRAAIMGSLLIVAASTGRLYQTLNALIFAAAIMILQNPKILSFDIGFQLSFAATLGIIYLSEDFEKWLWWFPAFAGLRASLAITLSAQIFTFPILVYYFDRLSVIAPVVNVSILWTMPYVMAFTALTGFVGMVFMPLARQFGLVTWLFLEYVKRVVEYFSRVPAASLSLQVSLMALLVYYLVLMSIIFWPRLKNRVLRKA